LSSQIPEVVLIAILSNFDIEEAERVLRSILAKLKLLISNKRVQKRYINQLMMLSRLRKIEALTIKIAEEMPIHFDYETDTLYLKGTEKGAAKEAAKKDRIFATYLVLNTAHSDEQIASIVGGLSIEYVKNLRLELKSKP
jgi:hypothetical protein